MSISRVFLDWSRPALPAVVEYLLHRYRRGSQLDLSRVLVVVPGGRSGRKLSQLLLDAVEQQQLMLLPPLVQTVGVFPEQCYESKRPFAGELVQQLSWLQALRSLEPSQLVHLLPRPPAANAFAEWLGVAQVLSTLHRELAADGLDFGDVAAQPEAALESAERRRWQTLHAVQTTYLRLLDSLELWDLQTARLYALKHRLCRSPYDLILVGAVDLNVAIRRILDQVAERVTALVLAPQDRAEHFDEYGCLRPREWCEARVPLRDDQLRLAAGPAEQAAAVVRELAGYDGRYRPDQVVIGVPDQQLVPSLQRRLLESGVPSRWLLGQSLPETAPFRFLEALRDYLEGGRFQDFAALVRHPDVDRLMQQQRIPSPWLVQLDRYQAEHLPAVPGDWLGADQDTEQVRRCEAVLKPWLDRFTGEARPLTAWPAIVAEVLTAVYGEVEVDAEQPSAVNLKHACRQLRMALETLQHVPDRLAPVLSGSEALNLLLDELRSASLTTPVEPHTVELLGWLELPLDMAPALIVTTFNEGFVPSSLNADLFLPNRVRSSLGLLDNDRRYARDAYAVSLLLASRERVRFIVGRRDLEGSPLIPSRLLFATDPLTMAQRARRFFGELPPEDPRAALPGSLAPGRGSGFFVPKPAPLEAPLARLSVTAFRTYLTCPYQFYLKHVLRLECLSDEAEELDAAGFGTLMHAVLRAFGESACKDSTHAPRIAEFLQRTLAAQALAQFGKRRLPAVDVQLLQLGNRLEAFAEWQAGQAREGWRIQYVEVSEFPQPARLEVDGHRSLLLSGSIDRIDYHEQRGEWRILDYKTGDSGLGPEQVHRKGEEWLDLQLPLYRLLARALGLPGPFRLGYIVLPKNTARVQACLAEWSEDALAEAEAVAKEVARKILDEEFWPPSDRPGKFASDFAAICQEGVFERQLES